MVHGLLRSGTPPIARHIKNTFASETAATDGERVYIYLASIGVLAALDMKGEVAWVQRARRLQGQLGVRHGELTGAPQRPAATSSTTTRHSRSSPRSTREAGDELWRTPATKRRAGPRRLSGRTSSAPRSSRRARNNVRSYDLDGKLLWELRGMTILVTPSPFSAHGLVYISSGYPGQAPRPVYAIQPGRVGRHLAEAGRDEQRVHRLVSAAARHLQHVGARSRRLLLHAPRPRVPALSRRQNRQADLRTAAHLAPNPAGSQRRPGPTTARSSC